MRQLNLPSPPDPDAGQYKNNTIGWERDFAQWARTVKGRIEQASRLNDTPAAQQITATAFTTNTIATGTTTGTDLSNVVCSLIAALTAKGILQNRTPS